MDGEEQMIELQGQGISELPTEGGHEVDAQPHRYELSSEQQGRESQRNHRASIWEPKRGKATI